MKSLKILSIFILALFLSALNLHPVLLSIKRVSTSRYAISSPNPVNSSIESGISRNWSGYAATSGTFTGVSGSWVVAAITNPINYGADATWVGIGGINYQDLIQAGTQTSVSRDGQVTYEAFYEILPDVSQPINIGVNSGDSVTVSIIQQSKGIWKISFKNNTTNKSIEFTQPYDSSLSSAEWIEEAPSGPRRVLPLSDFGTIQITDASTIKDGKKITPAQAGAQSITMVNNSGDAQAQPSSLGKDGATFTVTSTNIASTPPTFRRFYRFQYEKGGDRFIFIYNRI